MWQRGGALKGLMSDFWMLDMPKKGPMSPLEGLDVPPFAQFMSFI
jgi:hypothetical protein